ncbi:hypothetical protein ABLE68_14805 [Nocardioides sp. CN2-186]|uniref:lysylphosphatidylglycerol synthase domain-containing protein n=1 Tax=Nocardioides tweenelious TaxID=3156607 RepID=UPI0032B4DB16
MVLLVVAALVLWTAVQLVGRVDWHAVGSALGELAWWQFTVLVVVLVARQVFNGLPLAFYIEGLSVLRATLNDLASVLMALVAPPPSDLAIRLAMFSSWGIPVSRGAGGAVMNTVTFYVARFSAPLIGLLLLAIGWHDIGPVWYAAVSTLIAAAILVVLVLVLRGQSFAARAGATAARIVGRFRKGTDPEAWSDACLRFRAEMSSTFRRGFPRSILAMLALLLTDGTMLLLCLRFVGVGPGDLPAVVVYGAFLYAYPLTIFPIAGIGVVDAALLAAFVEVGGLDIEAGVVAALLVWRVLTVLGPAAMGAGVVGWWRTTARQP